MIITVTDVIFRGKFCYIIYKNQCIKISRHWWKHIINSVMPLWDLLKWSFSVTPDSYSSSFPPKNMRFQTAGMTGSLTRSSAVTREQTFRAVNYDKCGREKTSEPVNLQHNYMDAHTFKLIRNDALLQSPPFLHTHYCKLIHTSHTNLTECLSSPSFLPWRLIPPSGWTFPEDPGLRGGGWIRGWRLVGWVSVCTCLCVHVCK